MVLCVSVHIYVYTHKDVSMYIYIYMYTSIYYCIHANVCMRACTLCMYVYMYGHTYIRVYIYICIIVFISSLICLHAGASVANIAMCSGSNVQRISGKAVPATGIHANMKYMCRTYACWDPCVRTQCVTYAVHMYACRRRDKQAHQHKPAYTKGP